MGHVLELGVLLLQNTGALLVGRHSKRSAAVVRVAGQIGRALSA